MAHVLNKLTGVQLEDVKAQLERDAQEHAKQGMYLEHIWINTESPDEVYFLFRVDDLAAHQKLMHEVHSEALKENPEAKLPQKIYLEEA